MFLIDYELSLKYFKYSKISQKMTQNSVKQYFKELLLTRIELETFQPLKETISWMQIARKHLKMALQPIYNEPEQLYHPSEFIVLFHKFFLLTLYY